MTPRRTLSALLGAVLALLAAAAASAVVGDADAARNPASRCTQKYAHMGPLTGAAAVLGQEQLKWDRFALEQFNAKYKTRFQLVESDDQLNAAQGATVAQRIVSDPSIMAVVGPAGSQVVRSAGPIFGPANVAMVSESATDSRLSDGDFPTFFRVNAHNDSQAPQIFLLINRKLKAKKVFVVDDQTPDKVELANRVAAALRNKGVRVERETVNRDVTDFSSLVSKIDRDTDVVFLSWQIAANGQLFGQQMREQGKRTTIVGANGLYAPTQFTIEGAYVAAFAPDIRYVKTSAPIA